MLPVVGDHDRCLGAVAARLGTHVPGNPDELIARRVEGDDRLVIVVIDIRQIVEERSLSLCRGAKNRL